MDLRMTNSVDTPAVKPLLHKDLEGKPRKNSWNYCGAVGMLTYLMGNTRPKIAMAVHQCARFSNNPMLSHERGIKRIAKYLLKDPEQGIIYDPKPELGLECYVDFAGGWSQADADNADNVISCTGYVIMYAGCPVIWKSKLQTKIALSMAEAE